MSSVSYQDKIDILKLKIDHIKKEIENLEEKRQYFILDAKFHEKQMKDNPNVPQVASSKGIVSRSPSYALYNFTKAQSYSRETDEEILNKELKLDFYMRELESYKQSLDLFNEVD